MMNATKKPSRKTNRTAQDKLWEKAKAFERDNRFTDELSRKRSENHLRDLVMLGRTKSYIPF